MNQVVNNRFASPKVGWADVAIYFAFTHADVACEGVVCELQIVHKSLLLVREEMGAHDKYDENRFAAELLMNLKQKESAALPWARKQIVSKKISIHFPEGIAISPSKNPSAQGLVEILSKPDALLQMGTTDASRLFIGFGKSEVFFAPSRIYRFANLSSTHL